MTALHFERRWRALYRFVIKGPLKPLGTVIDYFARIEFQARGSPHLHMFFWIDDAPSFFSNSSENVTRFIDSVISTRIPNATVNPVLHNLVKTLQIHSHRPTCKRGNKCRFSFPYSTCEKTR